MTDISLPYDQVCGIIAETAAQWANKPARRPLAVQVYEELFSYEVLLSQFGHTLWRALEEAHFAREGKE